MWKGAPTRTRSPLAATLRGISKSDLVGEDLRAHRRAVRLAAGAVATLAVLAIGLIAAGGFAWDKWQDSDRANNALEVANAAYFLGSDEN